MSKGVIQILLRQILLHELQANAGTSSSLCRTGCALNVRGLGQLLDQCSPALLLSATDPLELAVPQRSETQAFQKHGQPQAQKQDLGRGRVSKFKSVGPHTKRRHQQPWSEKNPVAVTA